MSLIIRKKKYQIWHVAKLVFQLNCINIVIILENEEEQKDGGGSGLIDMMIKDNINFKVSTIENKNYFTLTLENLEKFESVFFIRFRWKTCIFRYIYKSMLQILIKYNLKANDSFFNYFIKGKSLNKF